MNGLITRLAGHLTCNELMKKWNIVIIGLPVYQIQLQETWLIENLQV